MNAFGLKDDVLAFIVEAAEDCGMSEVILRGLRLKKCAPGNYSPPVFSRHMELVPDDPRSVFLGCSVISLVLV